MAKNKSNVSFYDVIIYIVIGLALLRGLWVFDMGNSAITTNTTASAICLVGAIFAIIKMKGS